MSPGTRQSNSSTYCQWLKVAWENIKKLLVLIIFNPPRGDFIPAAADWKEHCWERYEDSFSSVSQLAVAEVCSLRSHSMVFPALIPRHPMSPTFPMCAEQFVSLLNLSAQLHPALREVWWWWCVCVCVGGGGGLWPYFTAVQYLPWAQLQPTLSWVQSH